MTARHWEHTGQGGCLLRLGRCKAVIYPPTNLAGEWVWWTFDVGGHGGENHKSRTRAEAMREAFGSLLMQGWTDPQRWQIGRPTREWPRLPPTSKERKTSSDT
jgi:hypothetical protein